MKVRDVLATEAGQRLLKLLNVVYESGRETKDTGAVVVASYLVDELSDAADLEWSDFRRNIAPRITNAIAIFSRYNVRLLLEEAWVAFVKAADRLESEGGHTS